MNRFALLFRSSSCRRLSSRPFKSLTSTALFFLCLLSVSTSFGWGSKGHEIVAYVGSTTSGPAFWSANADGMRTLSTIPDRYWKSLPTAEDEKPTHWFQLNFYINDLTKVASLTRSYSVLVNQYSEEVVIKNGTAPWRIRQLYGLALDALKAGDMKTAVEMAGTMSHYIGDLSQPLHVDTNYDGKDSGDPGIHKFFETDNIKDEDVVRDEVMKRALVLEKDPAFTARVKGRLLDVVYDETARSSAYVSTVIDTDKKMGRSGQGAKKLLNLAEDRMADGAATLAAILNQLWEDSGLQQNSTPIPVKNPDWVAPDFADAGRPKNMMMSTFDDDDCSLK
jgi:hypothetical protein